MKIIAISRGTLAGASLLAEQVASELQIPCISREIIVDAAREGGISEETLTEQLDNPPPPRFKSYSKERDVYLWHIRSALCQRALEGEGFVYHGHGGHLLLADLSCLLRVGVVAPEEFRIKAVMESQNVDAEEARKHVHHIDAWRKKWVHHLYGVDWYDPAMYDIVVNLQKLDVGEASHLVAQTAGLPRFTYTEETKQEIIDVALVSKVSAALAKGGELFEGRLELTAENNVLTISGKARPNVHDAILSRANQAIGDAELRFEVIAPMDDISWGS